MFPVIFAMSDLPIPRLLLLDDDAELAGMLVRYLEQQGFAVEWTDCIAAFRTSLDKALPALALLDVMLPDGDGISLARELSAQRDFPIIMLSARGDEVDRIVGLEIGADDYVPKPFNPRELEARIRAVLRRNDKPARNEGPLRQFGPYTLNLASHALFRDGEAVELSTAEFTLLSVFLRHPNQVLSRDRLTDLVQGFERLPLDRSIDARVARLRKRIEPDTQSPVYIRTVWGAGYLFNPNGKAL